MDCQFGNRAAVAVGPKLTEIVRRKCRPASADPRPASTLRQAREDGVTQPENGVQRRSPGHRDPKGAGPRCFRASGCADRRAIDWKSRRSSVISDSAPAFLAAARCSQSQTAPVRSDDCAQASAVPAAGEYGEGFRQGVDVDLVATRRGDAVTCRMMDFVRVQRRQNDRRIEKCAQSALSRRDWASRSARVAAAASKALPVGRNTVRLPAVTCSSASACGSGVSSMRRATTSSIRRAPGSRYRRRRTSFGQHDSAGLVHGDGLTHGMPDG